MQPQAAICWKLQWHNENGPHEIKHLNNSSFGCEAFGFHVMSFPIAKLASLQQFQDFHSLPPICGNFCSWSSLHQNISLTDWFKDSPSQLDIAGSMSPWPAELSKDLEFHPERNVSRSFEQKMAGWNGYFNAEICLVEKSWKNLHVRIWKFNVSILHFSTILGCHNLEIKNNQLTKSPSNAKNRLVVSNNLIPVA